MPDRVLFTDHTFDDLAIEREILADIDATVIDGESVEEPIKDLVTDVEALIVMYHEIDQELIERMERCQVISRTGIGVDNVDLEAASERGIYVTNVPDYCIPEVSDHVMALFLALQRKIVDYHTQVHDGQWDVTAGRPMHRTEGQTIGLVAFGNIARAVRDRAVEFGMEALAFDPYLDAEEIREGGATPVAGLSELLEQSDVVSVHTPLTPETEDLISTDEFTTMKETAFIINAARGGIIDETALAEALDAGELAGAGLDVLADEPPADDHPLVQDDRVILTPHAAWNSAESMIELREKAARNVRVVLEGDVPDYLVNRDILE